MVIGGQAATVSLASAQIQTGRFVSGTAVSVSVATGSLTVTFVIVIAGPLVQQIRAGVIITQVTAAEILPEFTAGAVVT
jgi:hypothetical protein